MRGKVFLPIIIGVLALGLIGFTSQEAFAAETVVLVKTTTVFGDTFCSFDPATVTVNAGDTVTFFGSGTITDVHVFPFDFAFEIIIDDDVTPHSITPISSQLFFCTFGGSIISSGNIIVNPVVECNGNGTFDSATNSCICDVGFAGATCNSCDTNYYNFPSCTFCESSSTCNANGFCSSTGQCECNTGFGGEFCSIPSDTDNDGVPDSVDLCPFEDATGQDSDGDGCIDPTLTCGTGTTQIGFECIADPQPSQCATGTTLNPTTNECEANVVQDDLDALQIIIDGLNSLIDDLNSQIQNLLDNQVTCGEGTVLVGNECLVDTTTNEKVTLCHKGKQTITISSEDVNDHIAHGDELGTCEE